MIGWGEWAHIHKSVGSGGVSELRSAGVPLIGYNVLWVMVPVGYGDPICDMSLRIYHRALRGRSRAGIFSERGAWMMPCDFVSKYFFTNESPGPQTYIVLLFLNGKTYRGEELGVSHGVLGNRQKWFSLGVG
jgi:hypothetical protein